jgi:uncharacterized RDD family membrane protein YckC
MGAPPPGAAAPPPAGATGYGQPLAGAMPAMANFGQRLGGYVIDGLITTAMVIPAVLAVQFGPRDPPEQCTINGDPNFICEDLTSAGWGIVIVLAIAAFVGAIAYWGIMVGKGQTVGMKALNIRVADMNTGQPIGTGRGVGRFFAMYLSSFLCYLGYLWMLWDDKSQTWHDKIVSTVVVDA